jgi:OPA family sugar phosphate sensor protein UhpC-like MFS transporter
MPAPVMKDISGGDPERYERLYRRYSMVAFLSVTFGYLCYYTTRMGLFIAKKPLIDAGILNPEQLGHIGFALLATYAVGKAVNGFLGDHVHLGRFFIAGLLFSALTNVVFGMSNSYTVFLLLWLCNGWFQSVGATTSGVTLTSWFSARGLGTRFSIWSISHNLGEWLSYSVTPMLMNHGGWRWAFFGPAIACLLTALILTQTLRDRPQSMGLAPPVPAKLEDSPSVASRQWEAARNPLVWVIGLGSACMYIARYALSSWGMLYLQEAHGYSLQEAGDALSLISSVGIVGTLSSGPVSDYLFKAKRAPVSLFYGVLLMVAMAGLFLTPNASRTVVRVCLGAAGFAIGGQLLFLGGLAAAELCSRRAAGAALGIVGDISYVGAALQDLISGWLIHTGRLPSGHYDFSTVKLFWIGATAVSLLLTIPLVLFGQKHPDFR